MTSSSRKAATMPPPREPVIARPPEAGQEEAAILAQLPESPRLRRILDNLEMVMHMQGFLHLSMDDLARTLHCSKATLYRLAGSREELFDVALKRWCARVRDDGWHAVDAADGWSERVAGYCQASVTSMRRCHTSFAFWRDLKSFPSGNGILMSHQKLRIDGLEQLTRLGCESGSFRDVHTRLLSELMLRCVHLIVDPDFAASIGMPIEDAVDEWYRIIEFGIIPRVDQLPNGRSVARSPMERLEVL